MKALLFILPLVLCSCRSQETDSETDTVDEESTTAANRAVDSSLPGPARAKAAAQRVRASLTRDLEAKKLRFGDPVFLRAYKEENLLELWVQEPGTQTFKLFRSYPIAAASGALGPKTAEGDRQVPEGFYFFARSGLKPDSTFHLAFNIGYPNAYDRHHKRTGSFIMVHGNCVSIGCLAMSDEKIEEIYTLCDAALTNGQPFIRIHLFPFRMTEARMRRATASKHLDFWKNLKQGHDHFEKTRRPPDTSVVDGKYAFE